MAKTKLQCDPICSTLSAMADRPDPVFRTIEEVPLIGTMSTYDSQAEASQGIPQQWRGFARLIPRLGAAQSSMARRLALAIAKSTTSPVSHMKARIVWLVVSA